MLYELSRKFKQKYKSFIRLKETYIKRWKLKKNEITGADIYRIVTKKCIEPKKWKDLFLYKYIWILSPLSILTSSNIPSQKLQKYTSGKTTWKKLKSKIIEKSFALLPTLYWTDIANGL